MKSRSIAVLTMLSTLSPEWLHRDLRQEPTDHLPPPHASHDAERIAKGEAKRARKAAKRAKKLEAPNADA